MIKIFDRISFLRYLLTKYTVCFKIKEGNENFEISIMIL